MLAVFSAEVFLADDFFPVTFFAVPVRLDDDPTALRVFLWLTLFFPEPFFREGFLLEVAFFLLVFFLDTRGAVRFRDCVGVVLFETFFLEAAFFLGIR